MSELRIGSLCTGYGGLDMAVQAVFGGELAWWSDVDPGPIKVMEHHHPDAPNLGDLKEVDWSATADVDILTAGYPCQPFSNAGKRLGTEDPRHLWPWIADAIGVLRPRIVVLENVAAHLRRGFDVVSADLAAMGYRVAFGIVSASAAGAPHLRKRLYVVAEDTDRPISGEWREPAPGEASGRGPRPDACGRSRVVATDSEGVGRVEGGAEHEGECGRPGFANGGGHVVADSVRVELQGSGPLEPETSERRRFADASRTDSDGKQDWVQYTEAIRRWERALGCIAPAPTVTGARGGRVLSPYLTEWMMGVPGRIMSVPGLTRNEQIKLAGNGVVPQQAELAIRALLRNLEEG